MLVAKYHGSYTKDKEVEIRKAIDSSPSLRNKKDLILGFIEGLTVDASITDEWKAYINLKKQEELEKIIKEESLNPKETQEFIKDAFKSGEIDSRGTAIVKILPPMSMFGTSREEKKRNVIQRLLDFFARFFGL